MLVVLTTLQPSLSPRALGWVTWPKGTREEYAVGRKGKIHKGKENVKLLSLVRIIEELLE
jgi:hypothetical protein